MLDFFFLRTLNVSLLISGASFLLLLFFIILHVQAPSEQTHPISLWCCQILGLAFDNVDIVLLVNIHRCNMKRSRSPLYIIGTSLIHSVHQWKKRDFTHTTQSKPGIITLGALMLIYFHEAEKHKQFPPVLSIWMPGRAGPCNFYARNSNSINNFCEHILSIFIITNIEWRNYK